MWQSSPWMHSPKRRRSRSIFSSMVVFSITSRLQLHHRGASDVSNSPTMLKSVIACKIPGTRSCMLRAQTINGYFSLHLIIWLCNPNHRNSPPFNSNSDAKRNCWMLYLFQDRFIQRGKTITKNQLQKTKNKIN